MHQDSKSASRREFVQSSLLGVATAAAALAPTSMVHGESKLQSSLVVGEGDHQYEVHHQWAKLPAKYTWQTTHNVAVDEAQNVYVIHEGKADKKEHPAIFVFDSEGKFIRAFGSQFQGGGHGIEVRKEGSEEFLYVCGYQQVKSFAKLTMKGDIVWWKNAPMESGVYAEAEDRTKVNTWGLNRFMPTNFAFLDDGGFLLADGYGSFYIHRYDKEGNWMSHFGGPGKGEGLFQTPHGIWIDRRNGKENVVVCDRANDTLQVLDLNGKYQRTISGFGLPANIDTNRSLLLVPELHARVSLLDDDYNVVARLGADVERVTKGKNIRGDEKKWLDGKFVHPHDACFAANGDIIVAEWVATGRITRLKKIS